jgi:3-hydroxymyristoyl/3-hydroxydecanoyl-(acyl carrier protein) dehydratase
LTGIDARAAGKSMGGRFSAFSFVDRISGLQAGARAQGRFLVPAHLTDFPPSLIAEAVGQLAAWVAMAKLDFDRRPVAGLAGEIEFLRDASPGETLDLAVEIESCDEDAIAYGGAARVNGTSLVELKRIVGPMLPMADFDSPAAVRADFETLVGEGAPSARLQSVPELDLTRMERVPGRWLQAALRIPAAAPFFVDHFPLRPVFPGTLLIDAEMRLARELAAETLQYPPGAKVAVTRVRDSKMRSFVLPGQLVEIKVEIGAPGRDEVTASIVATVNGKSIATGRMDLGVRGKR